MSVQWDIRAEGRAWSGHEVRARWEMLPEKIEMSGGKLLSSDRRRLALFGLLLENLGADAAVQLGNLDVWRAAVARLR